MFAFPGKQAVFANIEAITKNKQFRAGTNNQQITFKNSAVETGTVSEINQINFLVAHCVIRIGYEGYFDEHKKNNFATVSKNLKILIQLLGRQSEAATLQQLLSAVDEGSANAKQILSVMSEVGDSYRARQAAEQQWFFDYGVWTTFLMENISIQEDEYIVKVSKSLQSLIQNAPATTSREIISPISGLAKYNYHTTFTEAEYEDMSNIVTNVFKPNSW